MLNVKMIQHATEEAAIITHCVAKTRDAIQRYLGPNVVIVPWGYNQWQAGNAVTFYNTVKMHMGINAMTSILTIDGLYDIFRQIKLRTTPEEGDEPICDGRKQNLATLIRQISVDDGNNSTYSALAISVCSVETGRLAGSTQIVYFDDREGMVQKGRILTKDGPTTRLVREMNKNTYLFLWSFVVHKS